MSRPKPALDSVAAEPADRSPALGLYPAIAVVRDQAIDLLVGPAPALAAVGLRRTAAAAALAREVLHAVVDETHQFGAKTFGGKFLRVGTAGVARELVLAGDEGADACCDGGRLVGV